MGRNVFPTGTVMFDPEKTWNGYTLFNAGGIGAVLIDMSGKVVHQWRGLQGFPNKMIPGGKIFGSLRCRDRLDAYQDYADVSEVDWNGNVIWSFNHNQEVTDHDCGKTWVARQHHDYQIEGNPVGYFVPGQTAKDDFNKVLLLTHNNVKKPRISPQALLEEVLLEIDRSGKKLWSWHITDHFNEFNLSNLQKNAIFHNPNTHEDSFNGEGEGDLFHVNCASYLGPNHWFKEGDERFNPNNIIMDSREANIMWIIDHETGKIVWQIGPDYTTNTALKKLGPLIGMHHTHMIPQGLPGAGNILVFNNGGWAGYGAPNQTSITGMKTSRLDTSKVIEFNPVTLEVVWSFGATDIVNSHTPFHRHHFYSPLVSSAQRLPNGNTLIDEGTEGRFLEVTKDKKIVWEYVYPNLGDGLIFRAYRIPYNWIPQLTEEETMQAVIPPDNSNFYLPGAADPSLTEDSAVTVKQAAGYNTTPAKFNNEI
ncbi:aryl-sulfate sulfotransferase [Lactobacillus sp. ESL0703]|uniref:aryl-sulfate sulfotransferase n=1 Tax=Lactobacillus sp. ESL0703 TaxID=2983218 RepID=UPI0023F9349B|nr:aryl-sulfate sulfotransferase [Lactobacillus sp. ESL0703]MDF7669473.1 aryl-sulfate sulfotransferase [Lactobacillus sp. ESL0703]